MPLVILPLLLSLLALVSCTPRPPAPHPRPPPGAEPPAAPLPARRALAHVMVSFRHGDLSGAWHGWNHSNARVRHDPAVRDADGRRDIASVFYPLLGPYDMLDPALAEAHCRLAAAAGLDGFLFDVAFAPDREWAGQAVRLYVDAMKRHGLQGAVVYEDKGHWIWNPAITSRAEAVEASIRDLDAWLRVMEPVQVRVGDRPLVGFFSYEDMVPGKGVSRLLPEELRAWRATFPPGREPMMLSSWFKPEYAGVLDGPYDWIWLRGPRSADGVYSVWMEPGLLDEVQRDRERQTESWRADGLITAHMGGVWPGFDSRGCWGFGGEPQYAARDGGTTYQRQWQRMVEQGIDLVQVVTWNDWFEGSVIEPTLQDGYRYLELTRAWVARWKGTPAGTNRFEEIVADYWRASELRRTDAPPLSGR